VLDGATITSAGGDADIFELDAATDKPIYVDALDVKITSELGEAQEEWLRLSIIVGHTTSGNGSAVTPRPLSPVDAAAGFTAESNGATIASAGTPLTMWASACNVRQGWELWLPPEKVIWTFGANLLVVRMTSTLADDVTMNATISVVEVP
jgi:hypothetical protein